MLTFEQIKELIEIVTEQKLRGIEIERSGFRLKIDGQGAEVTPADGATAASQAPPAAIAPVPAGPLLPPAVEAPAEPEERVVPEGAHVLNSPIVGTFYGAPSPDSDPYVRVGDSVKKGQVLCIVEAMKLMNEIESDVDGKLIEIFPKNAQPVEFGEPLFAILPG